MTGIAFDPCPFCGEHKKLSVIGVCIHCPNCKIDILAKVWQNRAHLIKCHCCSHSVPYDHPMYGVDGEPFRCEACEKKIEIYKLEDQIIKIKIESERKLSQDIRDIELKIKELKSDS